jgi:hypothetical protein
MKEERKRMEKEKKAPAVSLPGLVLLTATSHSRCAVGLLQASLHFFLKIFMADS